MVSTFTKFISNNGSKNKETDICPHCRSESFNHMRSLPLKRKIDDLDVQAKGCEVMTKVGELNSHKDECVGTKSAYVTRKVILLAWCSFRKTTNYLCQFSRI